MNTGFQDIVLEYIKSRMYDKQVSTYRVNYKSYVISANQTKTLDYDNQIAYILYLDAGLKVSSDNDRAVFDTLNSVEERSYEHTGKVTIQNQSDNTPCVIEYIEVTIVK